MQLALLLFLCKRWTIEAQIRTLDGWMDGCLQATDVLYKWWDYLNVLQFSVVVYFLFLMIFLVHADAKRIINYIRLFSCTFNIAQTNLNFSLWFVDQSHLNLYVRKGFKIFMFKNMQTFQSIPVLIHQQSTPVKDFGAKLLGSLYYGWIFKTEAILIKRFRRQFAWYIESDKWAY